MNIINKIKNAEKINPLILILLSLFLAYVTSFTFIIYANDNMRLIGMFYFIIFVFLYFFIAKNVAKIIPKIIIKIVNKRELPSNKIKMYTLAPFSLLSSLASMLLFVVTKYLFYIGTKDYNYDFIGREINYQYLPYIFAVSFAVSIIAGTYFLVKLEKIKPLKSLLAILISNTSFFIIISAVVGFFTFIAWSIIVLIAIAPFAV